MESTEVKAAPDLRAALAAGMDRTLLEEDRNRPAPVARRYMYASGWHPCRRNLYLQATRPGDRKPFDVGGLYRMRRGRQRERDILRDLAIYGERSDPQFTIEQQAERVSILGRDGAVLISGVIDATAVLNAGRRDLEARFPLEVKSWLWIADSAQTVSDLEASRYTRAGAMQILSYLYAKSLPVGYLVLDAPDRPNLIEIRLEEQWDKIARFVDDAEAVVACLDGEAPGYFGDHEECRACSFYGRACNPPIEPRGVIEVINDPATIAAVGAAHANRDAAKVHDGAMRVVKDAFRGVTSAIVGDYLIRGRPWGQGWKVEIRPLGTADNGEVGDGR